MEEELSPFLLGTPWIGRKLAVVERPRQPLFNIIVDAHIETKSITHSNVVLEILEAERTEFLYASTFSSIPVWAQHYSAQREKEALEVLNLLKKVEQRISVLESLFHCDLPLLVNKEQTFFQSDCIQTDRRPTMFHCPGKNGEFRGCKCDPELKREDDYQSFEEMQVKPILRPEGRPSRGFAPGRVRCPCHWKWSTNGMEPDTKMQCEIMSQRMHCTNSLDLRIHSSNQTNNSQNCSSFVDLQYKNMGANESTAITNPAPCSDDTPNRTFEEPTDNSKGFCIELKAHTQQQHANTTKRNVFLQTSTPEKVVHEKCESDIIIRKTFFEEVKKSSETTDNGTNKPETQSTALTIGSSILKTVVVPILEEKVGTLYYKDLFENFVDSLWLQFTQNIDMFGASTETSWLSGRACFLHKLKEIFSDAYMQTCPLSRADTMASAMHVVNALSLYEFQELAIKQEFFHIQRETFVFSCFLLSNQQFARALSTRCGLNEAWYNTKIDILRNYLFRLARDKEFVKQTQNCNFLIECAEIIKDDQLLRDLNGKKREKLRRDSLLGTCSSSGRKQVDNPKILVVADGNIYDRARDPPGQRSVYIPPGDSFKESYRLSTFIKYPQEVPVNPRHLASAGFLYTGYKDRVKCFSCGLCCENWVYGDDVRSAQWHRSDCAFMRGGDSGNVPIGGGGLARFMAPPKSHDGNMAMDTGSPASNFTSSSGTARQVQPTSHQPSAGSILLSSAANQSVPMQTARPVQRNQSVFQIVEFATIPSAYHENFLKNLDLRKESERLRTFEHWPSETPTVYPADLAKSGFFYLGNLDRVQCFSCGGVLRNWNYGDNVQSEHRRHFPHCKLVQGAEPRNVSLTPDERAAVPSQQMVFHEPPDPSENEARDLRNMFQCQFPVSPHMRNEDTRFETFDHRWPSAQINATPRQIARAGFFFLGDRDRVKCWYCNGGLQNWDQQDEPWTEHAKWFPTCEFLLQRKGPDFVHRMVSMFPNLPRPLLRGPFDVPPANPGRRIQYGTASARAPSPPPPIIDPQAELQREQQKVRDAMNSDIVKAALEMGFERKVVKHVVKRRIRRSEMCTTVAELVDDVTGNNSDVSDSDDDETPQQTGTSAKIPGTGNQPKSVLGSAVQPPATSLSAAGTSTPTSMETEETSPSMQARIQELQEERKCKICLDNIADIVFVPCGHLCSCGRCAEALRRCPMCRMKIEKAIRTYMS